MEPVDMRGSCAEQAIRGAELGTRERIPVGQGNVCGCSKGRTAQDAAMGAREWLPVEQEGLYVCGERRVPRGAAVVVRE